ncbi:8786_t:CDS:2 [Ambispora gerdemannii]|uniref:8786_t:CDS:1 n=1 Tax=Ambispora gerdemannii TaxID=144530 RepID=A0A9N8Z8G8_9GLOM|nr:8786_t:CDS:2 [Ambispora gerdemannii]
MCITTAKVEVDTLPQRFTAPGKGALPRKWMDALPRRLMISFCILF